MRKHYRIQTLVAVVVATPIAGMLAVSAHALLTVGDRMLVLQLCGGLLLATTLVAALFLRTMRRTIARIGDRIAGLCAGSTTDLAIGGPSDFDAVGVALDRLGSTLELLGAQAAAIAAGDLDADDLTTTVPGRAGDALQRLRTELIDVRTRLARDASRDRLTGLLDRSAGLAAIDTALAHTADNDSSVALLLVDVDGLRTVNEGPGHHVGDALLREVAKRLRDTVGLEAPIARIDGDEFVVVVDQIYDAGLALRLAGRIVERLREAYKVDHHQLSLTASVGVAWSPQGRIATADLLSHAELAVRRAKVAGTGGTDLFDEHLQRAVNNRNRVESGLDLAISDGALELWYQPILATASGHVSGAEALVRWRLPDGRMLFPEKFVPVAEQSDLILHLDRYVIEGACTQLAAWRGDPAMAALTMNVNVSGRHLALGQLDRTVISALHDHGLAGDDLVIEISESQLNDIGGEELRKLFRLRDLGIGLAIDNFGTGFGSVAQLRRLPITHVKVDGSLVGSTSPVDRSILESFARLGATLDVAVVAQGIEHAKQVELITQLGFTHAQGYLLAPPMAAEDIWPWLHLQQTSPSAGVVSI